LIHALPIGLRDAARQFADEVVIHERHLRGLFKARNYRGRCGMALHLGGGDIIKKGWVNVDLNPAADLTLDLREQLPFAKNTFSIFIVSIFSNTLTTLATSRICCPNATAFLNLAAFILARCPTANQCCARTL
jgi:hypothetical protein